MSRNEIQVSSSPSSGGAAEQPSGLDKLIRFLESHLPRSFWGEALVTVAAIVFAVILGAILVIVSDKDVMNKFTYFFAQPSAGLGAAWKQVALVYGSLINGCVGTWGALAETSAQAAPLICAGLGVALAFRVGLFNIGGQGQAIWGSIGAAWVGFTFHGLPAIVHVSLAILVGLLAGALWAGLAGVLRARFGAHEVIVTIMLNYVAMLSLSWLLMTALRRPGRQDPIAPIIDESAWLPALAGRLHIGFILALLAAVAVWWILDHTKLGFRIRAVGANSSAARTAGMNVPTTLTLAMVISGIFCGLAGAQVALAPSVSGAPTALSIGLVGNVGFNAITVALLGRSKPLGVVLAGLLFGALQAGGLKMQAVAQTPSELANVLQAFMVMFVAAPMLVRTILPFLKERAKRPKTPVVPVQAEEVAVA